MDNNMKLYYDYTVSPLGKLFYETVWEKLYDIKHKKVLDFGSGFGFTSDFLAQNNEVVAIEIDKSMIEVCEKKNAYKQIHGGLSALEHFEDESFDVIICHLVLEFVEQPEKFLRELTRLLKSDGKISVVKHNRNGRIIQAVVQDYDLKETKSLINGNNSHSSAFGDIKYYENEDLITFSGDKLKIAQVYGVRALASLHSDIQHKENWLAQMLEIERELLKNDDFIKISYFNHILLNK